MLGLAAESLCLAARLLGDGTGELGLDPCPLRFVSAGLRLRRWLLRLLDCQARSPVRAGVLQFERLYTTRLLVLAGNRDQSSRVHQPSLLAAKLRPLLLRRLLRCQLLLRGLFPVVFVP